MMPFIAGLYFEIENTIRHHCSIANLKGKLKKKVEKRIKVEKWKKKKKKKDTRNVQRERVRNCNNRITKENRGSVISETKTKVGTQWPSPPKPDSPWHWIIKHPHKKKGKKSKFYRFSNLCESSFGSRDVAPDVILFCLFVWNLFQHITISNKLCKNKTKIYQLYI